MKFNTLLAEAKEKFLNTKVKPWRKKASALFYSFMCTLSIVGLYVSLLEAGNEKKEFLLNLFGISLIWLTSELLLIWFFYKSNTIPRYARSAFGFIIAFSNLWFLYFVLYKLTI